MKRQPKHRTTPPSTEPTYLDILRETGEFEVFNSPLISLSIRLHAEEDGTYTAARYTATTGEWHTLNLPRVEDALAVCYMMWHIAERLHDAASEAVELLAEISDLKAEREALAVCDDCEEHAERLRCDDCAEKCSQCENHATWCLPCAERIVSGLHAATFTEERPSVPCERP